MTSDDCVVNQRRSIATDLASGHVGRWQPLRSSDLVDEDVKRYSLRRAVPSGRLTGLKSDGILVTMTYMAVRDQDQTRGLFQGSPIGVYS